MPPHLASLASPPVGIVGGLGPFASAEFVRTLYALSAGRREQELPRVVLVSDPTCPDRTHALGNDGESELLAWLQRTIEQLLTGGAERIVICCVTLHAVLPRLDARMRSRVVSLVDVVMNHVTARGGRHLLLCTDGARTSGLFEAHALWPRASHFVVVPEATDQRRIHELIYDIKLDGRAAASRAGTVERLRVAYDAETTIAGCTELHLLSRAAWPDDRRWIDPLTLTAAEIAADIARRAAHAPPESVAGSTR